MFLKENNEDPIEVDAKVYLPLTPHQIMSKLRKENDDVYVYSYTVVAYTTLGQAVLIIEEPLDAVNEQWTGSSILSINNNGEVEETQPSIDITQSLSEILDSALFKAAQ